MISILEIEYIVFDWDNTLADTSVQMKVVMDKTLQVLRNKGVNLKSRLEEGYWNKSLTELMHFESQQLLDEGKVIYAKFMSESADYDIKIFEGATNLLKFLKRKEKRLFIISNKEESLLHKQIKSCNLWSYFEKISGLCPTSGVFKPSAKVFLTTLGLDVSPNMVLLIGDSHVDEETAKNFGCRFIYVNNPDINELNNSAGQASDLKSVLSSFRNSYIGI